MKAIGQKLFCFISSFLNTSTGNRTVKMLENNHRFLILGMFIPPSNYCCSVIKITPSHDILRIKKLSYHLKDDPIITRADVIKAFLF